MDLMTIQKTEYQITLDIWAFYQKWLKKMPLAVEAWRGVLDDANQMAMKYERYGSTTINKQINATIDRLEFISKNLNFGKEAYEE